MFKKAPEFNDIKYFIKEHNFSPEQIMNVDQSRLHKKLCSGITFAAKGEKQDDVRYHGLSCSNYGFIYNNVGYCHECHAAPHMYTILSELTQLF